MGFSAAVWHPNAPGFSCNWFSHSVVTLTDDELRQDQDFLVIPEIWSSVYVDHFKSRGFRVAVFVQNPYLLHVDLKAFDPVNVMHMLGRADLVLSVSEDTTALLQEIFKVPTRRILRQRLSVEPSMFLPGNKKKKITYMPRKHQQHVWRWMSFQRLHLPPGWELVPIEGKTEQQVASCLAESVVFAAFSEFEGLGLPPVEAALAGNVVVGYHGEGGKEYWRAPNFLSVSQGDLRAFVREISDLVALVELGQYDFMALNPGIQRLRERFSLQAEQESLADFVGQVGSLMAHKSG